VPEGSTWSNLLKEMAERWGQVSNGQVKLKIFAGGVLGDEGDMLRKVNIGQLQAAALSVVGLHDIDSAPQAIATPGMIADDQEWSYVFAKMSPVWDKEIEAKGYIVLLWGDAGWVHLFSKRPVHNPNEMSGMKVFAWSGDEAQVKAWKLVGLSPVVLSAVDMIPSLSTGMIEAYATTPAIALTAHWYEQTPYMTEAAWDHLPGATIVPKAVWDKIPADLQVSLKAIAVEYGNRVNAEVARLQSDAIAVMQKSGLNIVHFDDAGKREWFKFAEKTWPAVRGGMVSTQAFDEVKRVRDEYRAHH